MVGAIIAGETWARRRAPRGVSRSRALPNQAVQRRGLRGAMSSVVAAIRRIAAVMALALGRLAMTPRPTRRPKRPGADSVVSPRPGGLREGGEEELRRLDAAITTRQVGDRRAAERVEPRDVEVLHWGIFAERAGARNVNR